MSLACELWQAIAGFLASRRCTNFVINWKNSKHSTFAQFVADSKTGSLTKGAQVMGEGETLPSGGSFFWVGPQPPFARRRAAPNEWFS